MTEVVCGKDRAKTEPTQYSNIDPDFGDLGPARIPEPTPLDAHVKIHRTINNSGDYVAHTKPFVLNTSEYQGAILDLDGFLLNSERPIVRCIMLAAQELYRETKGESEERLPMSIVRRIKKEALGNADTKMSLIVRTILDEEGALPDRCRPMSETRFIDAYKDIRRGHFKHLIDTGEFKELVGACDFVRELSRKLGGKVSIYTGSPKESADLEIKALGLDEHLPMEYRVYSSDLPPGKGKPEPDGFLLAKEKLGLSPHDRWISGGDRWKDFIGAMAAGGCGVFLAVAENLDDEPFRVALQSATAAKVALSPAAALEVEKHKDELPERLILLRSLEGKSLTVK